SWGRVRYRDVKGTAADRFSRFPGADKSPSRLPAVHVRFWKTATRLPCVVTLRETDTGSGSESVQGICCPRRPGQPTDGRVPILTQRNETCNPVRRGSCAPETPCVMQLRQ